MMVLYSPDWTNTGFSFMLLTANLFRHSTLTEQGLYSNLFLNAYILITMYMLNIPQQLNSIVPLAYSVFFYVHVVLTPTKMEIPTTSALCA